MILNKTLSMKRLGKVVVTKTQLPHPMILNKTLSMKLMGKVVVLNKTPLQDPRMLHETLSV